MTIFKPLTDTGRYMPNSWIRPEEPILSTHDARCDFSPMLVVSVREGPVFVMTECPGPEERFKQIAGGQVEYR